MLPHSRACPLNDAPPPFPPAGTPGPAAASLPPRSAQQRDSEREFNALMLVKVCLICLAQCLLSILEYITKVGRQGGRREALRWGRVGARMRGQRGARRESWLR